MKYLRSTTFDGKDIRIRTSEFGAKNQFLSFPVFPYKSLNTNLLILNGKTDLRKIKIENSPPEFEKLDS